MHFKIGKFTAGLNDWLRYYVVQVGASEHYLRKNGSIQFFTGVSMWSGSDKTDSGNFPTIKCAIETIRSIGGTYEFSSTIITNIRAKLMSLSDDKLIKLFAEIEELCGPL